MYISHNHFINIERCDISLTRIKEAKEWVSNLEPSGGCNLLKALKHVMKLKDIDSLVIVLGSV